MERVGFVATRYDDERVARAGGRYVDFATVPIVEQRGIEAIICLREIDIASVDQVIARAAADDVVARSAPKNVITGSAIDIVDPAAPPNDVIAGTAVELVRA